MNVLRIAPNWQKNNNDMGTEASIHDTAYNLYQESYFREMLYLECCRVERSQRPFLLVLLDISRIGNGNGSLDFKKRIVSALNSTTREIDIKGWYRNNQVIGIMFFSMTVDDTALIQKKVLGSFSRHSLQASPLFEKLDIKYHAFPDKENTYKPNIKFKSDLFCEMLYIERRRAERSNNPFLLMLLNLGEDYKEKNHDFVKQMTDALDSTTREVDLKGWYKNNRIIGVIFTAMSTKDIDLINDKVIGALKANGITDSPLYDSVQITYHPFPEESNTYKEELEFDPDLYRDLEHKKSKKWPLLYLKRAIDIVGSLAALLVFLPAFIIIPIIIKLTSKGPIFFRQKRVGAFGKPFTFLKFRSMVANNDEKIHMDYIKNLILEEKAYNENETGDGKDEKKTYKIKNDPRITRIGKFIRKTSLDEIPQFINVLRGEMSIVGPRPPIPYELENYDLWHLRRILEFKPGITGIWQVKGRSKTTFNEMVRMDIHYINNWSLLGDVKLIIMTPLSMLLPTDGAY